MKRIPGIAALALLVSYHANAQHDTTIGRTLQNQKMQMSDTSKLVAALSSRSLI